MPRYNYRCVGCEDLVEVVHGLDELYSDCVKCERTGSMSRILSKPFIMKQPKSDNSTKVGELTKKYIEENKDILKQQQKEARKKTHESS